MDEMDLRSALRSLDEHAAPRLDAAEIRVRGDRRRVVRRVVTALGIVGLVIAVVLGVRAVSTYVPHPAPAINATQPSSTASTPVTTPTTPARTTPTNMPGEVCTTRWTASPTPSRLVEGRRLGETVEYLGRLSTGADVVLFTWVHDAVDGGRQVVGGTREVALVTDAGIQIIQSYGDNELVRGWVLPPSDTLVLVHGQHRPGGMVEAPVMDLWSPSDGYRQVVALPTDAVASMRDLRVVGSQIRWVSFPSPGITGLWSATLTPGASGVDVVRFDGLAAWVGDKIVSYSDQGWQVMDPRTGQVTPAAARWNRPNELVSITSSGISFVVVDRDGTRIHFLDAQSSRPITSSPVGVAAAGDVYALMDKDWWGLYSPATRTLAWEPSTTVAKGAPTLASGARPGGLVVDRTIYPRARWEILGSIEIHDLGTLTTKPLC